MNSVSEYGRRPFHVLVLDLGFRGMVAAALAGAALGVFLGLMLGARKASSLPGGTSGP